MLFANATSRYGTGGYLNNCHKGPLCFESPTVNFSPCGRRHSPFVFRDDTLSAALTQVFDQADVCQTVRVYVFGQPLEYRDPFKCPLFVISRTFYHCGEILLHH